MNTRNTTITRNSWRMRRKWIPDVDCDVTIGTHFTIATIKKTVVGCIADSSRLAGVGILFQTKLIIPWTDDEQTGQNPKVRAHSRRNSTHPRLTFVPTILLPSFVLLCASPSRSFLYINTYIFLVGFRPMRQPTSGSSASSFHLLHFHPMTRRSAAF